MSQPPAYSRSFSFTNFQAQNPTGVPPGSSIDLELNNAKATLDAVLTNIALIQRDDGALANGSVGLDQLSSQVVVGFNAPVVWVTGTTYTATSSTVFNGSGFYQCLVTHAAGVFATDLAAGKWKLIVNLAGVPLVSASQIAVTPSGSLTSDVQTSLQALDSGKAATSHTHVSTAISDSTTAGRALLTAPNAAAQNALLGTTALGFQSGDVKETAVLVLQTGWYWCDGSNKSRVTDAPLFNAITIQQTGTLNATAVVTGLSDTTNGGDTPISPGMPVSGTNIPANTVVLSVDSGTQVTLSAAATGSGTTALVFAPYGVGDGSTTFGIPNRAYVGVGRDNASGSASNITQVSTTITTTNASTSATVASATGLFVGMFIGHPKVPFGTKISTISGTTITMSAAATGAVSGSAVRFSPLGDAQTVGQIGGAMSVSTTISQAQLPAVSPTFTGTAGAVTVDSTVNFPRSVPGTWSAGGGTNSGVTDPNTNTVHSTGTFTPVGTISALGSGAAVNSPKVQPTIVMNYIIKR